MTPKICASVPEPEHAHCTSIEIPLERGFVATELAIAYDSSRITNRVAGRDLFQLRIVSLGHETTLSSQGGSDVAVQPLTSVPDLPDLIFAASGLELERALHRCLPRLQPQRLASGIPVALSDPEQALPTAEAEETAAVHLEGRPVSEEAAIPNAGNNLELSIEGDDYYPCHCDLFLCRPFEVVDGRVTVTDAAGWEVEISPAWPDRSSYAEAALETFKPSAD
jgi:hypothetical protein